MFLSFPAGSFCLDAVNPPGEDGQGLLFDNDGNPHTVGITSYIPARFKETSDPIILTFSFYPTPGVAGTAHFDISWTAVQEDGSVSPFLPESVDVAFTGAQLVHTVNLDISSWFLGDNSELFAFTMTRDSSDPLDTYAGSVSFMLARTNEV
jgi:hypothetical protein